MTERCGWVNQDPLYIAYHDEEWGVPVHDDRKLFEMLVLEGAQAGLSWYTVLKKREHYREAFDGFDVDKVAAYGDQDVERLLQNAGIIRNRLKVQSAITNAQAFKHVQEQYGSFDRFLWSFVDGRPLRNEWPSLKDVPASTPLSDKISKELKKRGFKFVGTTIVYAYMQAVGLVNDHIAGCFCFTRISDVSPAGPS